MLYFAVNFFIHKTYNVLYTYCITLNYKHYPSMIENSLFKIYIDSHRTIHSIKSFGGCNFYRL